MAADLAPGLSGTCDHRNIVLSSFWGFWILHTKVVNHRHVKKENDAPGIQNSRPPLGWFWPKSGSSATCRRHETALHCPRTALCLSPRFTCGQASSFVGSKTSRTMLCGRGGSPLRLDWPQAALTPDINSWVNTCRRYADMQKRLDQEQADEVNNPAPPSPSPDYCVQLLQLNAGPLRPQQSCCSAAHCCMLQAATALKRRRLERAEADMRMRNPQASPVHTPSLSAQPSSAARLTRQPSRSRHQAPAGTGADSPGAALQARAEARQQAAQAREAQRQGLKAYIAGQRRQVSSCRPAEGLWHEAVSCTRQISSTPWPGQPACAGCSFCVGPDAPQSRRYS